MTAIQRRVPRKLKPLLYPHRYKGAYGGRGSGKSHFFAEGVAIAAATEGKRIVCIREVQRTIKDSVKQLIEDKIQHFGLPLSSVETEIRGPNGALIVFRGMQSYNSENIKSLEGFDIAWVEEAQTLSQRSLDLLRPTLRKEGSELWFSWNPRYKTDAVDVFFRKNPPPDAISVMCNHVDNPWFPAVLQEEMAHDFLIDPDKAEHVWNGAYGAGVGAILAKWVNRAEKEGRINSCEWDAEGAPVQISSDIGFRDTTAFWFWQSKPGGFTVFDYDQGTGMDADDWAPRLNARLELHGIKPQHLGKIWLPQDAKAKTFQSKHSSVERFIRAFGANKIGVVPPSKKHDQISAAREVIDRCEFHKERCEEGLDGLSAWEFDYNEDLGVFSREPLHNWASHPGDAFAYGCQIMRDYQGSEAPKSEEERIRELVEQPVTFNDLWEDNARIERSRI